MTLEIGSANSPERRAYHALAASAKALGLAPDDALEPRLLFHLGGDPTSARDKLVEAAGWGSSTGSQILSGSRRVTLLQARRFMEAVATTIHPQHARRALLGLIKRRLDWVSKQPEMESMYILEHSVLLTSLVKEMEEASDRPDDSSSSPIPSDDINLDLTDDPGAELRP